LIDPGRSDLALFRTIKILIVSRPRNFNDAPTIKDLIVAHRPRDAASDLHDQEPDRCAGLRFQRAGHDQGLDRSTRRSRGSGPRAR